MSVVRARQLLADYIQRNHVAIEGRGGNEFTYVVAATVLNLGISEDKALELLEPWNAACVPPWDTEDLRTLIANASAYAQNDAGAWSVPPASTTITPDALDKLLADNVAPVREERARFNWMDRDKWKNIPAPVWLLKNKLMRNSIAMLYGPSGHYKSFIAMNLAAEVAQTGECAFYVAAEGIERMAAKDLPAWEMAYDDHRLLPLYLTDEMPKVFAGEGEFTAFARSVEARAAGRRVGIIFLDTLNRAMSGLNDNDAKDASRMVDAAEFLKNVFHCCVVLIHHTPKYDKETWRGSGVFYNDFDTVLAIHAEKETKLVKITVAKQKTDAEYPTPFWYEGKHFGPGLAFVPVDAKAVALLSDEANIFGAKNISKTLAGLGDEARAPNWISSKVLLDIIIPKMENETEQQRKDSLSRCARGLLVAIKSKKLDGYHDGLGKDLRWSLP